MTSELGRYIDNELPISSGRLIAAIIGDRPSTYARSPLLWNAAFKAIGLDAEFFPFDVSPNNIGPLMLAIRDEPRFLGGAVTVPYKVEVIKWLDRLDPLAERVGAVNAFYRDRSGCLVGYNTDGSGAISAISDQLIGYPEPLVRSLVGRRVLILGSGGAARAVSASMSDAIGPNGRLTICGRDQSKVDVLSKTISGSAANVDGCVLSAVPDLINNTDVLINATSVGQSGIRRTPLGDTCLEPYSALAPADPPVLTRIDGESEADWFHRWAPQTGAGILTNNRQAFSLLASAPTTTAVFDLVYSPAESTTLRLARLTGHMTRNGRSMNLAQAATAFAFRVVGPFQEHDSVAQAAMYRTVLTAMDAA